MFSRRKLLQIGAAGIMGAGLIDKAMANPAAYPVPVNFKTSQINIDDELRADILGFPEPEIRKVSFYNTHTGESVKNVVYKEKGILIGDAFGEINKILRDFRTGDMIDMDVSLIDLLDSLSRKLEVNNKEFNIISGYRSPKTNAMLSERSGGVAKTSLHMQGKAIDIRVPGVALTHLRNVAKEMKIGGVGYYAASNFVHVDTGRVRYW